MTVLTIAPRTGDYALDSLSMQKIKKSFSKTSGTLEITRLTLLSIKIKYAALEVKFVFVGKEMFFYKRKWLLSCKRKQFC